MAPSAVSSAEQVFDDLRTTRLNRYVHEHLASRYRRLCSWLDFVGLLAISTVGVGIWVSPATPMADGAIMALAIVSGLLALYQFIAKPAELACAHEAHQALAECTDEKLFSLVRRIKTGDYSEALLEELEDALAFARTLKLPRAATSLSSKLMRQMADRVNAELPPTFFASVSTNDNSLKSS